MPPVKTSLLSRLKADARKIAADVVGVGATVSVALAGLAAFDSAVHAPAADVALVAAATSVVSAVVAEARRIVASK